MANIELDGVNKTIKVDSGDLTLDVPGDIILDGDGADVHFRDDGTGYLQIGNSSNDVLLTSLQSDKDMIFKGVDGGSLITALTLDMSEGGSATFNKDVLLSDNSALRIGNGQDLALFHDGSNSFIRDSGTGDLKIISDGNAISLQKSTTETMAFFDTDGGCELYHDNAKKFETTATGVDVTGTVTSDGASLDGAVVINEASADVDFRVESNNETHKLFVDGGNNIVIVNGGDGGGTVPAPVNTNGGMDSTFQLQGANNANGYTFHIMGGIDAQNNPPAVYFSKSRSNTLGQHTILQNGDRIGEIVFAPADGVDRNSVAAFICADVDGTPGENDTPGRLEFHTTADGAHTSTERVRIHSHGQVLMGDTLSAEDSQKLHVSRNDKSCSFGAENRHGSLDGSISIAEVSCLTSASAAYRLFRGVSGNGSSSSFSDNEFIFQGNGDLSVDGSVGTGGADYAEMFEWKDGNSSNEDRRGYSVILDGNQIVKATDSDDASKIIGIVSAMPVVIGDSDIDDKWKSKYLKDDFGNYIMEEYTSTEWTETYKNEDGNDQIKQHSYATDRIPSDVTVPSDATVRVVDVDGNKFTRKKLNPDWDDSKTYVRRQDRKEWDAIGLMGKLRMLKGQPTGTNWIKMRDISDTVEEWLVR